MRLINLTIDVNSRKVTKYQDLVKIGDALSLSITALNGTSAYDFTGQTVQVFLKKADNTKVEQDATVSGNVIKIATMSEQSSAYVGQVEGELLIKDSNGNQITSSTFVYEVEGSVNNEVLVESQNDVQTLDEIQTLIDGYNFNADNLATQNTQATSNISTLTQKNSDAATAQSNLQTVINNANAFASTYNGLSAVQVSVTNLNYKIEAAAELTRDTIPSGFTQLSDLDYTTMSTTPNTIKSLSTSADSIAYVNGYKIKIPAGTVITLDAPPTSGTRDDLVFLECWKQTDVSGAITWNSRIRVVDGVDFNKNFGSSGGSDGYVGWNNTTDFTKIIPQGGLGSIPSYASIVDGSEVFRAGIYNPSWSPTKFNDSGLWTAGKGNTAQFNTTDGYVYAIPMFRVHRRNSGGYSVSNGNGSKLLGTIQTLTFSTAWNSGTLSNCTVSNSALFNVGDYLVNGSYTLYGKVQAIVDSTHITVFPLITGTLLTYNLYNIGSRVDKLLADIIVERDIIDLRHQVSLTGFNYQALLEENFDKLLRGELQTNAKTSMLKTYHGIPKTPIDANHVFYASLDGTTTAEVGGAPSNITGTPTYRPTPTGMGIYGSSLTFTNVLTVDSSLTYTIDLWIDRDLMVNTYNNILNCKGTAMLFELMGSTTKGNIKFYYTDSQYYELTLKQRYNHIRIKRTSTTAIIIINGSTITTITGLTSLLSESHTIIFADSKGCISDLSISNIDRGATFATLPQDFIDGYARIMPAFNEQRQTYSDALTSEYKCEQVKASGESKRQYSITQATGGQWTAGDTVKVKGLGGEIITVIVDSDTALATIIVADSSSNITVSDVSKISVGDTIGFVKSDGTIAGAFYTVNAIDTTNKILTLSSGVSPSYIGGYIIETTASSSSPLVKATATGTAQAGAVSTITLPTTFNPTDSAYNNLTITITSGTGAGQVRTISSYVGSTKVATVSSAWTTNPDVTSVFSISNVPVAGTWSNLGTNQATFTLGTLYALTTQNIQVEYSLNEVAGQGGISEVLTTTLAGEFNSKKLTVNPSVHLRDDFVGKVLGSTTVNPNIQKNGSGVSLLSPTDAGFYEVPAQATYTYTSTLDGVVSNYNNSVSGQIAQRLFSFDLISIVERKYGTIPALDVAGKVAWLKANIASIKCNWWGYGSCPNGNKAYFNEWVASGGVWSGSPVSNTSTSPSTLTRAETTSANALINVDGFIHFLAYTDASDGVTPSTIYTDYVNIELTLNTPTGYDVLAPENPRRDDGLSNMLLVRKETKELKSMFGGVSNSSGIVSYGDMVPKQGILPTSLNLVGGYSLVMPKAYLTTLTTRATGMVFNKATNFDLLNEYKLIDNTISTSLTDGSQLFSDYSSLCSMIEPCSIKGTYASYKNVNIGKITAISTNYILMDEAVAKLIDISAFNKNINFVPLLAFLVKNSSGTIYMLLATNIKVLYNSTAFICLDGGGSRLIAFQVNNRIITK